MNKSNCIEFKHLAQVTQVIKRQRQDSNQGVTPEPMLGYSWCQINPGWGRLGAFLLGHCKSPLEIGTRLPSLQGTCFLKENICLIFTISCQWSFIPSSRSLRMVRSYVSLWIWAAGICLKGTKTQGVKVRRKGVGVQE